VALLEGFLWSLRLSHEPGHTALVTEKGLIADLERRLASTRRMLLHDKTRLRQLESEIQELRRKLGSCALLFGQDFTGLPDRLDAWEPESIKTRTELETIQIFKTSRMYRLTRCYYRLFGLPLLGPVLTMLRRVALSVLSHTRRWRTRR